VGKYVGRHPAAPGLLIAAGCSCLFMALSVGVLIGGPLVRFDRSTADALHTYASEVPRLTACLHVIGALAPPSTSFARSLKNGAQARDGVSS
jgi:hypothetical protein